MARTGKTIGKYRLVRELGAGGMGIVFEAVNVVTEAHVALKVLNPGAAESEFIVGRFMREAKAAGRLRSRYVARVYDADRTATGEAFMVMELLHGRDLASALDRGHLDVARACSVLVQACAGLDEAHRAGIVHRDLKPRNLFLSNEGSEIVKVLDFGVSKVSSANDGAEATSSLEILGTLRYMSPEHFIDASSVDARSDIWALGVILYFCLEGALPFAGGGQKLVTAMLAPTPAPRLRRRDAPPALVDIVARCLEKDRTKRVASAAELAALLAPFATAPDIADALGEIRSRRHIVSPPAAMPAMPALDPMDPTMDAAAAAASTVGSTVGSALGSTITKTSTDVGSTTTGRGASEPTGDAPMTSAIAPPRADHTPSLRGSSPMVAFAIGIAVATLVLASIVVLRDRRPQIVAAPPPTPETASTPATPPPTVSIILLPAPPTPPPASASSSPAVPAVKAKPTPQRSQQQDAATPAIPTLL